MRTITKLLVANRAEIASRVFRTCRSLGIRTVAVFSDADAGLPFVAEADEAVRIGGASPATSYLSVDAVLAAARRVGADAIHPGYGFLSENAAFARAVIDAGLVWVGPPPDAIDAMGDKAASRHIAVAHGVPVVPGYDGDDQDDATFVREAARIGVPLLVKASAGGGGRGMRRVDDLAELPEALASARREATAAFGSGRLLLERYVLQPRHIEVQVMADAHGHVVAYGERECSIQRRHQKIVEECPSPAVTPELRTRLVTAACRAAAAVGYQGAGTVEFVMGPDGSFFFLEMNTRLQVEHPVTEEVYGVDLVAAQLRVAEGHPLDEDQDTIDLRADGHAIEVRLYAEDPLRGYLPAAGRLVRLDLPEDDDVRVDAGYVGGDDIPIHYDAMIAKVIAWGPDRRGAARRLRRTLDAAWAPGVVTNLPLLRDILADEAFLAGDLHTGFLAERGLPRIPPANLERGALVAAALAWWEQKRAAPWPPAPSSWRPWGDDPVRDAWRYLDQEVQVGVVEEGSGLQVTVGDAAPARVRVLAVDGDAIRLEVDGLVTTARVARAATGPVEDGETLYLHLGDGEAMVTLTPRFPAPAGVEDEPGSCTAPTPGVVRAVHVEVGVTVAVGQPLVTLEAMKMEHQLKAPAAGLVASVRAVVGQSVEAGALLVVIETTEG